MVGLDKCKNMIVGAAPIHPETFEFFMSINIPLKEGYGMTECSGSHTVNVTGQWRIGSCGKPMNGVETKIDKPDGNGDGEVRLFVSQCMYPSPLGIISLIYFHKQSRVKKEGRQHWQ